MSRQHKESITCPECNKEYEAVLWDSVNIQLNPNEKEKILNNEFFKYECPECGKVNTVVYTCLYHDMSNQLMVYLLPVKPGEDPDDVLERVEKINQILEIPSKDYVVYTEGYKRRVVFDTDDLLEKIRITDEGLDDRIIEAMKIFLLSALGDDVKPATIEHILFDANKGVREFVIFLDSGEIGSTAYDQEMYDKIESSILPAIEAETLEGFKVIDNRWALTAVFKIDGNDDQQQN